ncbi:MAG TPA: helix-turn-helix transcriptional regulator [Vicinamibacterales bacterium]|nr:helix-turn-helix transcriptional regulator [Vicinamibacterales bacterium]
MPKHGPLPVLGEFEQVVMLALLRLGPDAYGAAVCTEIESRSGRGVSVSAVHTTLERLELKGLVKSRVGDPTPQRGGKRKRHYEVAAAGMKALQASYRSLRNMAAGLEHLLGEPA